MTKSFTRARDRSLDGPCIEGHKQVPKNVERGLTRLWQIDRSHRGRAFARAIAKADVGVDAMVVFKGQDLSLIHISEPTRPSHISRMPSSA